jgi:hypothetical protein
MKKVVVLSLLAWASHGYAVELYSNGPVVDGSGLSILTAPATTLGAGSNAGFTLADNFSVTGAGWNVASLDFFGYQTQTPGPGVFSFTSVSWSIVSGSNINTGSTVASGTTAVTNGGLMGYRVASASPTNQQRALFRISADIPDVALAAGSYFVTWALAGTVASGPFVAPVEGSLGSGNGLQSASGAAFVPLAMGGSLQAYDVPFSINGTVLAVPEVGTSVMMCLGGLGLWGAARRRVKR